jgi:hypothetical protein
LGLYVKRWQRWVAAGLQGITIILARQYYDEPIESQYHSLAVPVRHNTAP